MPTSVPTRRNTAAAHEHYNHGGQYAEVDHVWNSADVWSYRLLISRDFRPFSQTRAKAYRTAFYGSGT